MTKVNFHTGIPDRQEYAWRWLFKAVKANARVVVFDDNIARLAQFDDYLWQYQPTEFLPHVMATDALASVTPIVLTSDESSLPHHAILLNLSDQMPSFFSSFERLEEFSPDQGEGLIAARKRYKFYSDHGYPLQVHAYRPNQATKQATKQDPGASQ
jgi:DNA polymerase III subunit chi